MESFTYKPTGDKVEREQWCWIAEYDDGTFLRQFDDDTNEFHQFREIDQSRLHLFGLSDGEHQHMLLFPDGGKLIHFYRNPIFAGGTPAEIRIRVYCFGYESNGNTVIMAIMPDGNVVVADHPDKIMLTSPYEGEI